MYMTDVAIETGSDSAKPIFHQAADAGRPKGQLYGLVCNTAVPSWAPGRVTVTMFVYRYSYYMDLVSLSIYTHSLLLYTSFYVCTYVRRNYNNIYFSIFPWDHILILTLAKPAWTTHHPPRIHPIVPQTFGSPCEGLSDSRFGIIMSSKSTRYPLYSHTISTVYPYCNQNISML